MLMKSFLLPLSLSHCFVTLSVTVAASVNNHYRRVIKIFRGRVHVHMGSEGANAVLGVWGHAPPGQFD